MGEAPGIEGEVMARKAKRARKRSPSTRKTLQAPWRLVLWKMPFRHGVNEAYRMGTDFADAVRGKQDIAQVLKEIAWAAGAWDMLEQRGVSTALLNTIRRPFWVSATGPVFQRAPEPPAPAPTPEPPPTALTSDDIKIIDVDDDDEPSPRTVEWTVGALTQGPRCPQGKKNSYPSRLLAHAAIRTMIRDGKHQPAKGMLKAYRCEDCRLWHVGHRQAKKA